MFKKISMLALVLSSLAFIGCSSAPSESDTILEDASPTFGSFDDESVSFASDAGLNDDSDSGKAGSLQTVYFDFNSSNLSMSTQNQLSTNAQYLIDNPSVMVQVEGHADERGSSQYNLALGERRASAVRDYLMAQGVDSARISTISYGKEKPLAYGHDEDSWAKNRRANFVIVAR